MFLSFVLIQFKVEVFLLLAANLSYMLFIRLLQKRDTKHAVLLGIALGITILIKISFAYIAGLLLVALLFISVKNSKYFINTGATALSAAAVVILWIYLYGIGVPVVDWQIDSGFNLNTKGIDLGMNKEISDACIKESKLLDADHFVPMKTSLERLAQPYYVLTNQTGRLFKMLMGDPGIILYVSILLFPFIAITQTMKSSGNLKIFYLITLATYAPFFVLSPAYYWYLMPVLPFITLTIPIFIKEATNTNLKKLVKLLIVCVGIILSIRALYYVTIIDFGTGSELDPEIHLYSINNYLNTDGSQGYILDASQHPYFVFLTFVNNYDRRVIKSQYYFVATDKSLEETYTKFKEIGIKYILVQESALEDPWYKGCSKENNELLKKFLDKYTTPINLAHDEGNFIFELN